MRLVTIDSGRDGTTGAVLSNGDVLDFAALGRRGGIAAWIPTRMRDLLTGGREGMEIVRRTVLSVEETDTAQRNFFLASGIVHPAGECRLLSPIPDPLTIISSGMAYRRHLEEMGAPSPPTPIGFLKSSAAVTGPNAIIPIPPQCPSMVDFEGELCVVFGSRCHNVSVETAMDHVAGYMITNDVSARDWVHMALGAKTAMEGKRGWDFNLMGKQLPGFSPFGPWLVTADELGDPHSLRLVTRLNGEVMQEADTSDLIFPIAETIAFFAQWYVFEPGDIITTGTPSGVGFGRQPPVFLSAGDAVEVEISRLGTLTNTFA